MTEPFSTHSRTLAATAPDLQLTLTEGTLIAPRFEVPEIVRKTVSVTLRDGIRLATDLYLPPIDSAPTIAVRTPYGRAQPRFSDLLLLFACHGYAVASQDCRGTGDSEPEEWDYYVYEREDSYDFVEWLSQQPWCNGFLSSCGSSYVAQTQWCMALHPAMSTIAPEVGGLGIASHTARLHMFLNAYSRSVGKGDDKLPIAYDELERAMLDETLATGLFNEPVEATLSMALLERFPNLRTLSTPARQRWLWQHYCTLSPVRRAEFIKQAVDVRNISISTIESLPSLFGQSVAHDAHMFACSQPEQLVQSIQAPALMITGWYDWGLNDALATWEALQVHGTHRICKDSRLLITPGAHNTSGYHEGKERNPELERTYRVGSNTDLLLRWYSIVRADSVDSWPRVIYYLMGANQWMTASAWPPPDTQMLELYLRGAGVLDQHSPGNKSGHDSYIYDPLEPPPTVGGSIVSYVYTPGSVDVSEAQRRADVMTYTTAPLDRDLDVVGPLQVILYASSSAVDTDFSARLSDVFPDGRAIQLQAGLLRTRFRNIGNGPELLEPERIYRFKIDLWATANRFKAGHCVRIDLSSADFPRFDRNANLAGAAGTSIPAVQVVHYGPEYPSRVVLSVLG